MYGGKFRLRVSWRLFPPAAISNAPPLCSAGPNLACHQPTFASREATQPTIQSVVHFSIPVSDIERSTRFYTEIVGCRHLATLGRGTMAFLDAAGTCLILVKRDPPINPRPEDHGGVHHSFAIANEDYPAALDHLRKMGSKSPLRRIAMAASSTGHAPIFTTPTVQCSNSSI